MIWHNLESNKFWPGLNPAHFPDLETYWHVKLLDGKCYHQTDVVLAKTNQDKWVGQDYHGLV